MSLKSWSNTFLTDVDNLIDKISGQTDLQMAQNNVQLQQEVNAGAMAMKDAETKELKMVITAVIIIAVMFVLVKIF